MLLFGRVEEMLVTLDKKLVSIMCETNGEHVYCDKCQSNGRCRVKEKTDQQIDYIFSSIEDSVFLKACPGSGKTEVVAMKAAYEISKWKLNGGIAILSFTNNAADVIHSRVSEFMGLENVSHPHFIGTFDSWLHGYIAHPFLHQLFKCTNNQTTDIDNDKSYRIIDEKDYPEKSSKPFLHCYKLDTQFVSRPNEDADFKKTGIWANNVRWESQWELINARSSNASFISVSDYYHKKAFMDFRSDKKWLTEDKINEGILEKKRSFNSNGYATYNDIERLCCTLLVKKGNIISLLSKRFPLIVIDEAQDLSLLQLKILEQFRKQGSCIHFVGDLQQAIYEFKKVDPALVEKFATDKSMQVMNLTNNFRSNQNIVNICQKIISPSDKVKGNEKVDSFPCVFVSYPKDEIAKLPAWFENYLTQREDINLKDSLIITRGRGTISRLRPSTSNGLKLPHEFALSIKLWDEGSVQSITDSISLMGKCIASKFFEEFSATSSQFYKPSIVSKVSDWRTYISIILNECILIAGVVDFEMIWPEWARLIKTVLPQIIKDNIKTLEFSEKDYVFNNTSKFNLKSPKGETKRKVIDTIKFTSASTSLIPIRTIHSVKGQTFEAVMLVSSISKGKGSKTGHWEEWLSDKNAEAARLAYVASSRPEKILVWAVPDVNKIQKNKLIELGLQEEKWEFH